MSMEFRDLSLFYYKAKRSFEQCIQDSDNDFLKNEINIPVEEIIVVEKNIKIVFSRRAFESYLIEVSLSLFEVDKEIGRYLYVENDKKEGIDDSLVFY